MEEDNKDQSIISSSTQSCDETSYGIVTYDEGNDTKINDSKGTQIRLNEGKSNEGRVKSGADVNSGKFLATATRAVSMAEFSRAAGDGVEESKLTKTRNNEIPGEMKMNKAIPGESNMPDVTKLNRTFISKIPLPTNQRVQSEGYLRLIADMKYRLILYNLIL